MIPALLLLTLSPPPPSSNVLIVLADDVGVDMVSYYGEAPNPPCTPTIDALAQEGLVFRQAWANPTCSPTRALIQTGRYSFRTGIGKAITAAGSMGLDLDETTLPELLPEGYSTRYIGKWHLGPPGLDALTHPMDSGWGSYAGSLFNLGNTAQDPLVTFFCSHHYNSWVKTTDGVEACEQSYATVDTIDDAVVAMRRLAQPWLIVVSTNAIHSPFHDAIQQCPPVSNQGKGMMESLDAELARLVEAVPGNTYTVFAGDNGTAKQVAEGAAGDCFDTARSKGTVYQGGVRVPLIIGGPGVAQGEVHSIVSLVDLYATVADLVGVESTAEDSVSLVPYLRGGTEPLRETVYAERFLPNGDPYAADQWRQAVRDERWKLIRRRVDGVVTELELYDVLADPCEATNLYPPGTPDAVAAFDALLAELP